MHPRQYLGGNWWAVFKDPETGSTVERPIYILGNLRDGVRMDLREAITRGLLRDVRDARDDRQEDVAKLLSVSRETISRWENGHDAPRAAYCRLLEMAYLFNPSGSRQIRS